MKTRTKVLLGLLARQKTGKGQLIDVSMLYFPSPRARAISHRPRDDAWLMSVAARRDVRGCELRCIELRQ